MSVLIDRNPRLLDQSITGSEGSAHATHCAQCGTILSVARANS